MELAEVAAEALTACRLHDARHVWSRFLRKASGRCAKIGEPTRPPILALENTGNCIANLWHVLLQQSCGIVLEVLIGMLAALLFKGIC